MKRTDPCLVVNGGLSLTVVEEIVRAASLLYSLSLLSPSSLLRPASLLLLLDYLHLFFSSLYLSSLLLSTISIITVHLACCVKLSALSLSLSPLLSYRAVVPFSIPPSFRLPPQSTPNTPTTKYTRSSAFILIDAVSPFLRSHAYPGFDELIASIQRILLLPVVRA